MKDELSPQARAFLDSATQGDDPTSDDRARVRARVFAAVAAGGVVTGAAASAAAATSSVASASVASASVASGAATSSGAVGAIASLGAVATKGILVLALVGAGTAGVITMSSYDDVAPIQEPASEVMPSEERVRATPPPRTPEPPHSPPPESTLEVLETPAPVPTRRALAESSDVQADTADRVLAPAAPAGPSVDLASELSILRAAQRARLAGDPRTALQYLDDHARQFPSGSLAAERDGTRALALCDAGEVAAARAAADAFVSSHPHSPLRQRVAVACR